MQFMRTARTFASAMLVAFALAAPARAAEPTAYKVVVNQEEQYSIWPADRQIPTGWRAEGFAGTKEQCIAHIEEVWTDMRPLSFRRQMQERKR